MAILKKSLIVGVGNPLRSDDGFGPRVIKELQAFTQNHHNFDLLDGGTDALALIETIKNYTRAIIIDAINVNVVVPAGTIKVFSPHEAKINIKDDALSTHGFGLAEMLNLISLLQIQTEITIVGVQPKTIDFGDKLSAEIENSLPEVLALVQKLLKE